MDGMQTTSENIIARIVLAHCPGVQGIYVFGSHGTVNETSGAVDMQLGRVCCR
jgi:hypothetical protein